MTPDREPTDVEARLRASLNAYADAVDERPARPLPGTGARSRPGSSPVRGWRAPALVAAAALAVSGGVWLFADLGNAPFPTAASGLEATVLDGDSRAESAAEPSTDSSADSSGDSSAEAEADAEAAAGAAADAAVPGALTVPPEAEVGVSYPFDLYTHCGIHGADVGGVWFAAEPPLVEEAGRPPAGWGNPYQRGTLTLESAEGAVFRDRAGHELALRAAPDSERPPPCE